jgi:hypothetical protein
MQLGILTEINRSRAIANALAKGLDHTLIAEIFDVPLAEVEQAAG